MEIVILISRQIGPYTEQYENLIPGNCICGQPVIKVIRSSLSTLASGNRYHIPSATDSATLFRCPNCSRCIEKSFVG